MAREVQLEGTCREDRVEHKRQEAGEVDALVEEGLGSLGRELVTAREGGDAEGDGEEEACEGRVDLQR